MDLLSRVFVSLKRRSLDGAAVMTEKRVVKAKKVMAEENFMFAVGCR
jgi:hypothetical protein